MLLSELEIYHSRPIAPTRRIALGSCNLPCDEPPGVGGLLLGAVAARFSADADDDLHADLLGLTHLLEAGRRIPQPRLRHRFQEDRVGLTRSVHRLHRHDDGDLAVSFSAADGSPLQYVLAAIYAAGLVPKDARGRVLATVRRGLAWRGAIGPELLRHLAGRATIGSMSAGSVADPVGWAMGVLGLDPELTGLTRNAVQQGYREALRCAHPDHGGSHDDAAVRIADISEARRILMAT